MWPDARTWNGESDRGGVAPAGVYFVDLAGGGERVVRRLARVR